MYDEAIFPPSPETQLSMGAGAQTLGMQIQEIPGRPEFWGLVTSNSNVQVIVPKIMFDGIAPRPGEIVMVCIAIFRASVEPVPEKLFSVPEKKLILPGKPN